MAEQFFIRRNILFGFLWGCCLIFSIVSEAQTPKAPVPIKFKFSGKLKFTEKSPTGEIINERSLEGVTIELRKKGKIMNTLASSKNGKYEFFLEINSTKSEDAEYELSFSKAGMLPKTVSINTFIENPDAKAYIFGLDVDMMEKKPEDIVLNLASGEIKWNGEANNFTFNKTDAKTMQNPAVKKAEEEAKAKAEAEAKAAELKVKLEAEAIAKKKAEEEAKAQAKVKADAELKAKLEAEAIAKKKAEEEAKAKADAELKAKLEAEALAKKKAEEEAKAKADAELKAKLEAEALAKKKAEEEAKAKADAEVKAKLEAETIAKKKVEEQAKAKADAELKAKLEAEEIAKKKAEEEAKTKAKLEAETLAKKKSEEEAKMKAKADSELKAKLEAEALTKKQAEEAAKAEAEALAKKKAEESLRKKTSDEKIVANIPHQDIPLGSDLDIDRKKLFQDSLIKKYPEGITEEVSQESSYNLTKRIVVKDSRAIVYYKKAWNWGGTFFFKEDQMIRSISENTYNLETSEIK